MAKRAPDAVIAALREIRDLATLETASFDWEDSTMTAHCRSGNFKGRPDTFIKERVRLHHQTYIISPLEQLIAWADGSGPAPKRRMT